MNRKKWLLIVVTVMIVVMAGVLTGGIWVYSTVSRGNFNLENGEKRSVYVRTGDDVEAIVERMTEQGVVVNPNYLRLAARVLRMDEGGLKAGHYVVSGGESSMALMQRIRRGEQTPVKIVINSVRTPEQFAAKVSRQLMMDSAAVMGFVKDREKMASVGFEPEELFVLVVSNTYEVWWTITVEGLMKRLKSEHEKFWGREERDARAEMAGLTRGEVVTLASIVDEETAYGGEKRRIAGLYLNRLRCGMLLQSDPTVKFALGDFELTQVLYSHLSTDSPYNTYRYAGLPPGPIRLPDVATIDAVLHAEEHDYLYMCADAEMNGTHRFAKTLGQHNVYAREYHAALRRWKAAKRR